MDRVAIVADTACDIPQATAESLGVRLVAQLVYFGEREYAAGTELQPDAFWDLLTAPGAPFPRTSAPSPAAFEEAFRAELGAGASAVICICVGSKLSATVQNAGIARAALPDAPIHVVDSALASEGQGLLVRLAAEWASSGASRAQVLARLEERRESVGLYATVDTLEYLRRGGRISPAQAAIGSVLSVKPIITLRRGVVETVERPRTRGRARGRLLELLCDRPIERLVVMHGRAPAIEEFVDELVGRTGIDRSAVAVELFGPAVGPYVGPGGYGAGVVYRPD
jgi:fatty acid kinase fatty acid binding subunit